MASLKSYEQRLLRHFKKAIESAFQSKVNMNPTNEVNKFSNQERGRSNQTPRSSFRGVFATGRGRYRNERGGFGKGTIRGKNHFDRNSNGEGSSRKCHIREKDNHSAKDCWFKEKPRCHDCGGFGHVKKDCRATNNQQAKCAEERGDEDNLSYACQSIMEHKNDVWFLDSGCSKHMAADKNVFLDMDNTFKSHVKLGNGALVEAKGKGTIGVQTNEVSKFTRDVLLVPELDQNLLSVGQLLEHGYKLDFVGDGCIIHDNRKPRKVVKKIKMQSNRSFLFTLKYMKSVALKVEIKDESWLWHRRFGQLNFHGLKLLSPKGIVQGLPTIEDKHDVCEGCALGKH
ncbi:hypothetical protein RJ639_047104 [Escallonia herrerae]|uniref:CCHC-type domain-containing protein n=1 Tax=Escallonia herrerae TaxID=1293975 RepID=A0AA88WFX8_9ASTE|nr:hypothetical protein RJ639_047104 [Escallonia herrerae]